jgi:hypothetical protein
MINNLIETLKDGEKGFQTAAQDVKDPSVKATFSEFARQLDDGGRVERIAKCLVNTISDVETLSLGKQES